MIYFFPLSFEVSSETGTVGAIGLVLMIVTFLLGQKAASKKDGETEGERKQKIFQIEKEIKTIWSRLDEYKRDREDGRVASEGLRKDIEALTNMVANLDRDLRNALGVGGRHLLGPHGKGLDHPGG